MYKLFCCRYCFVFIFHLATVTIIIIIRTYYYDDDSDDGDYDDNICSFEPICTMCVLLSMCV